MPAGAVTLGGWFDLEADGDSARNPVGPDPFACRAFTRARGLDYVGEDGDLRDPLVSPIHADLAGLPPLFLQVGQVDLTRDDAVTLALSTVRVLGCTFEDVPSDGLDLDRCVGTIVGSTWRNCGNDGLDLMESRVRVEGSRFTRCGDKGISVGEASSILLTGSKITDCKMGLQTKDASAALVVDSSLLRNGVGLHAYMKKWSYGYGGTALLLRSRIESSRVQGVSIEGRPSLFVSESQVDSIGVGKERVHEVKELPAQWAKLLDGFEDQP